MPQLRAEITITEGLQHENVVMLREAIEEEFCIHLVLELYEGGTLRDAWAADGPVKGEGQIVAVVRQLFCALAYLLRQLIAHRDVKMENMVLTASGQLKLLDFGCARQLTSGERLHDVVGSIPLLAPEVLATAWDKSGCTTYGIACDVWAGGVVAFALLGGYLPFGAPPRTELKQVCEGIVSGSVDFTQYWWPSRSSAAHRFVDCLLVKEQERPTAEGLLRSSWLQPA